MALARRALEHFELERLVVMVAGIPPHKPAAVAAERRFRLAEVAFARVPRVELSRFELERDGAAYTVETARYAKAMWGETIFLVGADEFADFLSWHEPDAILEVARLGVATRPGTALERLDSVLRALRRPERVEFFALDPVDISSRDLRRRVASGESIDGFVPGGVAALVSELDLYRG